MKKRYLSALFAMMLAIGTAFASGSMASAEYDEEEITQTEMLSETGDDTADSTYENEYGVYGDYEVYKESVVSENVENYGTVSDTQECMLFDSYINLASPNKVTVQISLLSGDAELNDCSIVFAVTFDGQEYPCEIVTPQGQHYARFSVDAYNTEEIVGLGTIAYYRINNVELGTYTIASTADSSIFNCSVDMGVTNSTKFMISENGLIDDSRTGNAMSQDEYDAFVEDIIESESVENTDNEGDVIRQCGVNLEGITGDIEASEDDGIMDSEEFDAMLQEEIEEIKNANS